MFFKVSVEDEYRSTTFLCDSIYVIVFVCVCVCVSGGRGLSGLGWVPLQAVRELVQRHSEDPHFTQSLWFQEKDSLFPVKHLFVFFLLCI